MIDGVNLVPLEVKLDDRGSFSELYRGIDSSIDFVQVNLSKSRRGVARGMHYHKKQTDLWIVVNGEMQVGLYNLKTKDIDLLTLDGRRGEALIIKPGVAHGFLAISDVILLYLVTHIYDGTDELGFRLHDLDFGWGDPIISERDRTAPSLDTLVDI